MKIEELQIKIGSLEQQIKDLSSKDLGVRTNISEFLGSTSFSPYGGAKEVKVLSWSNIYFEIGKLVQKKHNSETDSAIAGINESISFITNELQKLKEITLDK